MFFVWLCSVWLAVGVLFLVRTCAPSVAAPARLGRKWAGARYLFWSSLGGEKCERLCFSSLDNVVCTSYAQRVVGFASRYPPAPPLLLLQQVGGALFVDVSSTLDVVHEITFQGNSLAIEYDLGIWVRHLLNSLK